MHAVVRADNLTIPQIGHATSYSQSDPSTLNLDDSQSGYISLLPLTLFEPPAIHPFTSMTMSTDKSARHYIETISTRPQKPIEIVDYDPSWPTTFASIAQRIRSALGATALSVSHVGSTSVPGLPAKAIIDVDLVVPDPTAEDEYAPALEAAGFQFLFREPNWYEHRFFGLAEPYANVHVFGPGAAELSRHQRFREWLVSHPADRELYVQAKREAARQSQEKGESVQGYNLRKERVIEEIMVRAGIPLPVTD